MRTPFGISGRGVSVFVFQSKIMVFWFAATKMVPSGRYTMMGN